MKLVVQQHREPVAFQQQAAQRYLRTGFFENQ
jgi:hypothetical protein